MEVPFFELRFGQEFEARVMKRWQTVLTKREFISGPAIKDLAEQMLDYTKANHFVPCANGTDAIQIALKACGVGCGDTVLLPDFTFWATYEAVVNLGAHPVLIDISSEDFQMDFSLFQEAVSRYKPRAAIIVHLYGWCSKQLADFREFCQKEALPLIEDAAQAFGTLYEGESLLKNARFATMSFYPAKVLGAAGDAGAIFCRDEDAAKLCLNLSNHGRSGHYSHSHSGWNSRMDELQAHFLLEALQIFPSDLLKRKAIESQYWEFELKNKNALPLSMPHPPHNVTTNAYLQVSLAKHSFAKLSHQLKENGIKSANTYPMPVSSQQGTEKPLELVSKNRVAHEISQKILNLPLFPGIKAPELECVMQSLLKIGTDC